MKIFVTGGTGFVGREVVRQLLERGHQVRALIHRQQNNSLSSDVFEAVSGDTRKGESLSGLLAGCDAVIHLVGIIREFPTRGITFAELHTESTRNMVQAATAQGVSRFLHMSANGARADAVSAYHQTKWAAEEALRHSTLEWTIFRPSLIFGPQDQFVNLLAQLIRMLPLVPVMGDGKYRLQPVSVGDVAAGFVRALENKTSIGQCYHCGGPEAYSYDEILDLIGKALGKPRVRKLHHPLWLMQPVISVMQSLPQFPMTRIQLQMLLEGNVCDPTAWQRDFQLDLSDFFTSVKSYLT